MCGTVEKEGVDASALACCQAVTNIERAIYTVLERKRNTECTKGVIYGYRRTGIPEARSERSGWAHPTLLTNEGYLNVTTQVKQRHDSSAT